MGYGFLYLMDEDTDRRVDEYSVRNNYRIRFANFSRIYLQRNDKTRTRPPRGDGKPFSGAHHRGDRPHDRPPPSTNGGRKPRRGNVVTELPSLRQGISNQPRLRHGLPPRPPPPLPRIEPPELWNRYPVEYRAQRAQPDHSAPHGYHQDSRSSNYEGCYFEQPQGPTSAEYYEDQQHPAVAYGQTDGYEASADYHHQHGYAEHGCGQQAHQGYGDQEHGYFNDDGHAGYYDGGGQYNEAGVYQQGEYYDGNHCSEPYAYPQQRGVARQAADHGYSRSQQYSAEPYQGTRDNTGYAHPGGFNDASYSYPQDGSHLQNHTHSSTAGHGSYQQSSGNYHGGTQGGYSHGGRGRGGGSAYAQRFQRRDRPY